MITRSRLAAGITLAKGLLSGNPDRQLNLVPLKILEVQALHRPAALATLELMSRYLSSFNNPSGHVLVVGQFVVAPIYERRTY